ncbi:MAG: dipeptidase [Candidatus Sericytochromatia bacterium]
MAKTLTLLVLGLACLGGAALLREQVSGPQSLEPVDQKMLAQMTPPSPTPSDLPARPMATRFAPMSGPSLAPRFSPGASGSPQASPSGSPGASPSGSGSPAASGSPGASPSPSPTPSGSPSGSPASVAALHKQAVVVDTHVESPYWITESKIHLRSNKREVSLEKLKAGGVDVVFFSIMVNPARYGKIARSQAEFIIQGLKKEISANQDLIELATSYADIKRIVAKGKIAGLMGMEGGDPIEDRLSNVDRFYKLGVRYLGPTWSVHTQLGDSSGPARSRWNGLSPLGKQVIRRMNQLGMLVDVSHLSDASFNDVLKLSSQPVIASHSGVDGARVSARNLSDNMLKLMAVNDGVVGILFYPPFLETKGKANLASVVRHIDYAVKVAGIDHVGLGSDFDGLDTPPPVGLEDASKFPAITAELKKHGYKDDEILKILGGNFMKVFEKVLK